MSDLVIPLHTLDSQRRAADPEASAWVSANAGAGKTKVLTDRVLRLLLSGAQPGRILCLTFTKAAAANMAMRVFERLGHWVTLDDIALAEQLRELEGKTPGRATVRNARKLFARAIETPGGLKIETLHAFCERLLHLVPFEANVPARFNVLDENLSAELTERMVTRTLGDIVAGREPKLIEAWNIVSAETSGDNLRAVVNAALRERLLASGSNLQDIRKTLAAALQINPDSSPENIRTGMLETGLGAERLAAIASVLAASPKPTDRDRANDIRAALAAPAGREKFERYRAVFFTQGGTPRSSRAFVTQSIPDNIREELFAERDRLDTLNDSLKAAEAFERTMALFALASRIRQHIEQEKAQTGALDFDDLVHKTLDVLSRSDAAWVLYKLDRGIDHVLVDEAQDTNPEQWEILRLITEDFTSGLGIERKGERTLFAVGDPKQSIYGFQGAAPQEFEHSRIHWSRKVKNAGKRFEDVRLTLSFRSVKAVLSAVDSTFSVPENFRGLSFEEAVTQTIHESARPAAPGQVILWPVERPEGEAEPEAWVLPVDQPETTSPPVVVARRIARTIGDWLSKGDENGRIWQAGDILILARKRGAAFEAVIRALKERGVAVAGQDRIDIGSHIAVLDLIAAGRAALLPQDDLTLATALKSPLVGLTEDELFSLAANRQDKEALVEAIDRHASEGNLAAQKARTALDSWRVVAREFGPFGFYATLLGYMGGRAQLVARLGTEAGDAIDAFLSFARNAELVETPSLLTFLCRFDGAAHSIKRDFESIRNEVRVMTVHGAKGLEAPVTIMLDGCDVLGRDPSLVPVPGKNGPVPVWTAKKADCRITGQAREAMRAKALEEHHRLLYVAMTRARDKLLVAPFMTAANRTVPSEAWCEMIRQGLEQEPERITIREMDIGPVLVWGDSSPVPAPEPQQAKTPGPLPAAPSWLFAEAEAEPEPIPPLRPSSALGAADTPPREVMSRLSSKEHKGPEDRNAKARLRGIIAHTLMEQLPQVPAERQEEAARSFLSMRASLWPEQERDALISDILHLLKSPALAALFSPASRAEVPIAGTILLNGKQVPVSGQIDRFSVTETEVLIADFKTSLRPPAEGQPSPRTHVLQLALYASLLRDIYPDYRIRPLIIWTTGPLVRELSQSECAAALTALEKDR